MSVIKLMATVGEKKNKTPKPKPNTTQFTTGKKENMEKVQQVSPYKDHPA